MKYLLAYVIWNKVNMLDWIVDGIVESFNPKDVDLLFVLDNPVDGSKEKLFFIQNEKLKNFNFIKQELYPEQYKFRCQNYAMKYTVEHNYKAVLMPQDDQKITDKNLISNIEKIINQYGDKLGLIGMRDGFNFGYGEMISSEWSESTLSTRRLKNGEFAESKLLNDGGLIYTTELIKKIGYHDVETFKRFYIEDDYCARAHYDYGLTNIVMGNDLIHKKENASFNSDHYDEKKFFSQHDLHEFTKRWKSKIDGQKTN